MSLVEASCRISTERNSTGCCQAACLHTSPKSSRRLRRLRRHRRHTCFSFPFLAIFFVSLSVCVCVCVSLSLSLSFSRTLYYQCLPSLKKIRIDSVRCLPNKDFEKKHIPSGDLPHNATPQALRPAPSLRLAKSMDWFKEPFPALSCTRLMLLRKEVGDGLGWEAPRSLASHFFLLGNGLIRLRNECRLSHWSPTKCLYFVKDLDLVPLTSSHDGNLIICKLFWKAGAANY